MPVIEERMTALVKRYGPKRGKSIYYAMENMEKHGGAPANAKRKAVGKKKPG